MLLHSILDTISEPKEWTWQIPRDDNWFDPLHKLLKIRKWGILQKDKLGKWEKPKNKLYMLLKKPKAKPPLNRKGNIRLNKNNG